MVQIGGGALGIVLAFLGFVLIAGSIRGTYVSAYDSFKAGQ